MVMMGANTFIDTNVLLRATIAQMELHAEATALLAAQYAQGASLWISRQVIREYVAHVTRPQLTAQPLSPEHVRQQVTTMMKTYRVADETEDVTQRLVDLINDVPVGGKQIHDANIIATMLVYRLDTLLTANMEDMRRFGHLVTLEPLVRGR